MSKRKRERKKKRREREKERREREEKKRNREKERERERERVKYNTNVRLFPPCIFGELNNYRIEARVEASGYTAIGKFLDAGGGAGRGRCRSGGRGGAL